MDDIFPPPPKYTDEVLEGIIAQNGGLFSIPANEQDLEFIKKVFETQINKFNIYVARIEQELYKDRPRKITYGFLNRFDLNAFAYATPVFDFIGINAGVIFTVLNVFYRILSHPNNFPEVGNASLEIAPEDEFLMADFLESGGKILLPKCPVRASFASILAQTVMDFLFFHEVTHLRNGHLEFSRDYLNVICWTEINNEFQNSDFKRFRQTLEMDADCGAIQLTLNEAFFLKQSLKNSSHKMNQNQLDAMNAAYENQKRATQMVLYSTYIFFRLFDSGEWNYSAQTSETHPHPTVRMCWLGPTLYEIFLHTPTLGYDAMESVEDGTQTILAAEEAFANIRGHALDMRGLISVFSGFPGRSEDYLNELKETWRAIKPTLEKFKRGGKLAD